MTISPPYTNRYGATPGPSYRQCAGITAHNTRCRRSAEKGSNFCPCHANQAYLKTLREQQLATSYTVEPLDESAYAHNIHNSDISIVTDPSTITLYQKKPRNPSTEIIELTDDEAYILHLILKQRYSPSR